MSRKTGPDQPTAELVTERLSGMCLDLCGRPGEQIHHRLPRGMGGTRNPHSNSPANLVYISRECHERIESNRAQAYEDGWLVRRGEDPAEKVLVTQDGRTLVLQHDGTHVLDQPFRDLWPEGEPEW